MIDARQQKIAQILVNYSTEIKPGEYVLIQGHSNNLPLLLEFYRECLKAGANPEIRIQPDGMQDILFEYANDKQLSYISPVAKVGVENYDVMLALWGDINTKSLTGVSTDKQKVFYGARTELLRIRTQREAEGKFRWCGTQYPNEAAAQDAEMSLEEFEDFMYNACLLNTADPIAEWRRIETEQQIIVEYLNKAKQIRVLAEDTDLSMSVEGCKWINCCGKVNFPDGEIFTSPRKETVQGHIRFSFPVIYQGHEADNVYLEFKNGKVVNATADKGLEFLEALLNTDEGSRYLGEIAIGTNYNIQRFTRNMLFDEKMGGTVHAAVGLAIPEAGGDNVSAVHMDMLCNMRNGGQFYADDTLIYENGEFVKGIF